MPDFSPHQRKIIDRYYKNHDAIKLQRLSEIATELYLVEGKKRDRLWIQAGEALRSLEIPEPRVALILEKRDPTTLVAVLQEIEKKA